MKNLLTVICVGFCLFICSCKNETIQLQRPVSEISIDGDASDWENAPLQFVEDFNGMLGLANDDDNMYVVFKFSDGMLARKIRRFGATFWIDIEGDKNKQYGIRYASSKELADSLDVMRPMFQSENSEMKSRAPQLQARAVEPGFMILINGEQEDLMAEKSKAGPAASSNYEGGSYCYELRIPLPLALKDDGKLGIGIEVGGISQDDMKSMRSNMGGGDMGGRMGGGRMGGGRRGGGMRGGSRPGDDMRKGMEKQEYWFKAILAQQ